MECNSFAECEVALDLNKVSNHMAIRGAVLLLATASLAAASPAQDPGPLPNPPSPRTVSPPPRQPQSAPQNHTYHTDAPPQAVHSPGDSPIVNDPPSMPVDQIIKRFSERESEFKIERGNYTYTQSFSIQTIDDDNRPDGEYREVSEVVFSSDGKRLPDKVTYAPQSTLERIQISEQDLDDVRNVQPFVLTTEDLPKYNVTYVGRQQVDELSCYVFDVAPKVIEKKQRYFQGRVWVEDKDLQIVMSDGKAVPDIINKNNENVFPRFRTYRQNIEKGYWFPVYTRADDYLHFRSGDVHIRMTIRYSNYKRFGSTVKMGTPTEIKDQH